MLKTPVKVSVLILYATFTIICIYGSFQMKTYFSLDSLMNDGHDSYDFVQMRHKYWGYVYEPSIYVDLKDDSIDFFDESVQLQYYLFE